ncbi:DUF3810 domain-containing protein [Costertonia aggregata]|uniref:DUF3810 domain-containing protein n=1 Tax=Costertonia aggregata TaxID=343403 RepID=A0A7H9AL76_9FLAO|nr:DUF3810 domain-containing protein [Costertonia aggregata]QLG44104.1 DUF3810 domain-containing protein [Costertonia aggregata]
MDNKLRNGIALSLIPQIILVKWLGSYTEIVENHYSRGVYPIIAKFFRALFGWVPFSVGDVVYALLIVLAVRYVFTRRRRIRKHPKVFLRNMIMVLSVAYFTFHLLWGLNYYRKPIAEKFDISDTNTEAELVQFVEELITKTNTVQFQITSDSTKSVEIPYSKKEIFKKTLQGYQGISTTYPFLRYETPSIKKSIFSVPLTYAGYGGYLNPFTNEAQVNGRIPKFRYPVVSAHEIGHQTGYSAENETNFIGYLVTANNPDIYFKYSAYAYALSYCLSDIKRKNEPLFDTLIVKLNKGVLANYQELNDFWAAYENPFEPIFKSIFSSFLKINNQSDGIKSYSRIVSLLVAYHKKHPL